MINEDRRPEIDYPCIWNYKVIGNNVDDILAAVKDSVLGLEYSVRPSNVSRTGKYFSFNISIEVPNEVVRDLVFENLQKNDHIKFVI